jgi:hypothetical protein
MIIGLVRAKENIYGLLFAKRNSGRKSVEAINGIETT